MRVDEACAGATGEDAANKAAAGSSTAARPLATATLGLADKALAILIGAWAAAEPARADVVELKLSEEDLS